MKTVKIDDTLWFLEDDSLVGVLAGLPMERGIRRGHFTLEWGAGKVFIKRFQEKGFDGLLRNRVNPRGRKEYRMGKRLLSLCVATPKPLGYGISRRGSSVIQEWAEGRTFFEAYGNSEKQGELLTGLVDLLRLLKRNHIRHNDLHLNNIIVRDGDLILIDLHKMRIKRSFHREDEVSNLSHAVNMIYGDMTEDEKRLFFERYGDSGMRSRVEGEMRRLRGRWIKRKMDRAFDNTSVVVGKGNHLAMAGFEGRGRDGFLSLIKEDRKVRIERHNDHIRKIYRDGRRLRRAWRNHVALAYLNLAVTPTTYGMTGPSMGRKGYIAMEDLKEKGEELDRFLDRHYDSFDTRKRRGFIHSLAAFFAHTAIQWVLHRDMKACNLFVLKDGGFLFLDVEDIVFQEGDCETVKRALIQLNTTIPKRITAGDRVRFFLCLTRALPVCGRPPTENRTNFRKRRKALFQEIFTQSLKMEIVYEGTSGLVIDRW